MTSTSASGSGAAGLVLFHGAGGDRDHRLFVALENSLDIPVGRINFPYRAKGPGRRFPDRMPVLVDAVEQAVEEAAGTWGVAADRIVAGGRSMGGRAASVAAAEGRIEPAGLAMLSYPLHPPAKPDKLRVDHFEAIDCPVLLIQGRRDPFGSPDEFAEHLPSIAGPLTEHWFEANHDPPAGLDPQIVDLVDSWLRGL